jgi:hypothetical protein
MNFLIVPGICQNIRSISKIDRKDALLHFHGLARHIPAFPVKDLDLIVPRTPAQDKVIIVLV